MLGGYPQPPFPSVAFLPPSLLPAFFSSLTLTALTSGLDHINRLCVHNPVFPLLPRMTQNLFLLCLPTPHFQKLTAVHSGMLVGMAQPPRMSHSAAFPVIGSGVDVPDHSDGRVMTQTSEKFVLAGEKSHLKEGREGAVPHISLSTAILRCRVWAV